MGGSFFGRIFGSCGSCRNDDETEIASRKDPIIKSTHKPVFAVPLTECERSERFDFIPKLVVECISFIEKDENIRQKGIYRISGHKSAIDELKRSVW